MQEEKNQIPSSYLFLFKNKRGGGLSPSNILESTISSWILLVENSILRNNHKEKQKEGEHPFPFHCKINLPKRKRTSS